MDDETKARYDALVKAGYNNWVAEALAERGISADDAKLYGLESLVDEVLGWNGIIGYSRTVIDMVDNLRNQGHD